MIAPLQTPVAFIIFNRPDLTAIVFEEIRKAKPVKLLVIADGPRFEAEAEKCSQARSVIRVDWQCELLTCYADVNLGCRTRLSSGLDWVFEQVEAAIILEDDCLPHPSFFPFCQTMLNRYKDDKQVYHVAGTNFQHGVRRGEGSYYFSKYPHIWGWATWKTAWKHYDVALGQWPAFRVSEQFARWCFHEPERQFWYNILESVYHGETDTWDFQWVFTVMNRNGYCIMPNVNLVSNIGFRADATHTLDQQSAMAGLPVREYPFTDIVPPVVLNEAADRFTFDHIFNRRPNPDAHGRPAKAGAYTLLVELLKQKLRGLFN